MHFQFSDRCCKLYYWPPIWTRSCAIAGELQYSIDARILIDSDMVLCGEISSELHVTVATPIFLPFSMGLLSCLSSFRISDKNWF